MACLGLSMVAKGQLTLGQPVRGPRDKGVKGGPRTMCSIVKFINKAKPVFSFSYLDKHIWKARFEFRDLTLPRVSLWNILEATLYTAFLVS